MNQSASPMGCPVADDGLRAFFDFKLEGASLRLTANRLFKRSFVNRGLLGCLTVFVAKLMRVEPIVVASMLSLFTGCQDQPRSSVIRRKLQREPKR